MKIFVPVKRAVDFNVKVRVKADRPGVDVAPRRAILKVVEPVARSPGVRVADVAERVSRLRKEAKVLR